MDLHEFEHLLKSHNWLYQYQDNYKKWQYGSNQRAHILQLVKELGPEAEEMYESYRAKYSR